MTTGLHHICKVLGPIRLNAYPVSIALETANPSKKFYPNNPALVFPLFQYQCYRKLGLAGVDFKYWFAPYRAFCPTFTPQNSFSKVIYKFVAN